MTRADALDRAKASKAGPVRESTGIYTAGRATRELLIATAERLFAERGIDGVSLREVASAAGTRNTAAAQYYFGDKETLLLEIFRRHSPTISARRLELLDRAAGADDAVRSVAEAIVRPLAEQIGDAGFLSFLARCQSDHVRNDGVLGADVSGSFLLARRRLREHVADLPLAVFQRRYELMVKLVVTALAGVEWRLLTAGETFDVDDVVLDLVDVVAAMMLAPSNRSHRSSAKGRS